MVGERTVDIGIKRVMLARQPRQQPLEDLAAGTIAVVPADPIRLAIEIL